MLKGTIDLLFLMMIPFLVSLNWLIGGNLIQQIPALPMAGGRLLFATLALFILFLFTSRRSREKSNVDLNWLKNQFILSITGRVIYTAASIWALALISPFEAIVLGALTPIFLIAIEGFFGSGFKNRYVPTFGLLSVTFAILSLTTSELSHHQKSFSVLGYALMIFAVSAFSVHLSLYKRFEIDKSSIAPLMTQFAMATIILLPFGLTGFKHFFILDFNGWLQFFLYSVVCNLTPFILVHHSLKKYSPFTVGSVSILAPLMAFLFRNVYSSGTLELKFLILSLVACGFVFLTTKFDRLIPANKFGS
jgi:drug/metabolite transporter (DMT)-like permease